MTAAANAAPMGSADLLESIVDRAGAIEAITRLINNEDGAEFFTRLSTELRSSVLHHIAGVAESIAKDSQAALQSRGAKHEHH